MRIFVTGGSGFVGKAVINDLLNQKHEVCALIRKSQMLTENPNLTTVIGDTTKAGSLKNLLTGYDAVIHLVGIIREFPRRGVTFERLHTQSTQNIVRAASEQGVTRYLHMSANGTREKAVSQYHQTKWAAEEIVRQSGLDWTIFRPSLIFGSDDEFINMLARMIKLLPVVPVFGDGRYQIQPVHVDDVAAAFISALGTHTSFKKIYCCCGPQSYSYDQLLDTIGLALGHQKSIHKIHQPLMLIKPVVALLQSLPFFPITKDQLQMLIEGNNCNDNSWSEDLKITPMNLEQSIASYLK